MKKKKGFTLVELLVVIAILAVLATVSVVGYMGFTKKAHESNDIGLTTQMNTILQAEEVTNKPSTPHEAVQQLANGGVDVEKLTPTTDGYNYVYDLDTNRMFLLDDQKAVVAPTNIAYATDLNVFAFVGSESEITSWKDDNCSFYLKSGFTGTTLNVTTGLDVGDNEVDTINYTNTTGNAKNIIIRTNSYNTSLNVDGASDTVKHYDLLGNLKIENIKNESYHEYGKVKNASIKNGRFVAEEGSELGNEVTIVEGGNAIVETTKSSIWGEPTYTWSDDNLTCTARMVDLNNLKEDIVETVNTEVKIIDATVDSTGKKIYTATFTNSAFETKVKEITLPKLPSAEEQLVDKMNDSIAGYDGESITKALVYLENKGLNITVNDLVHSDSSKTFAFDINQHKFYIVNTIDGSTQYPSNANSSGNLVYVVNNKNDVSSNMTRIYFNDYESIKRSDVELLQNYLVSVELGGNVTNINNENGDSIIGGSQTKGCFYSFNKLTSIYVGNSVKYLGYASFAKIKSLQYVYFNTNVEKMITNVNGYFPFTYSGENNSIKLEIGKDVISFPGLFMGYNDQDVYVNEVIFESESKCTVIEEYAFHNFSITEITLPKTISSIKGSSTTVAFYGCSKLKTLNWYGESITCGGKTYDANNQDSSGTGRTGFEEYMRNGGSFSKGKNIEVIVIK